MHSLELASHHTQLTRLVEFFKAKEFHTNAHMHAHAHPESTVLSFLCSKLTSASILQKLKHYVGSHGLETEFFDDWIIEQKPQALLLVIWRGELYPHNTAKACPPGWHNKGACEMLKVALTAENCSVSREGWETAQNARSQWKMETLQKKLLLLDEYRKS